MASGINISTFLFVNAIQNGVQLVFYAIHNNYFLYFVVRPIKYDEDSLELR